MATPLSSLLEFYSKLWGGAYNIIVPTDGKVSDDRFWAILEAFHPDYLYAYKQKGEDILLIHPQRFHEALENQINVLASCGLATQKVR